ncbi:hypothetical protein D3C86_2135870 [compost metagenome]
MGFAHHFGIADRGGGVRGEIDRTAKGSHDDIAGGHQGLCLGQVGQQQHAEGSGNQRFTHGASPKNTGSQM